MGLGWGKMTKVGGSGNVKIVVVRRRQFVLYLCFFYLPEEGTF